MTAELTRQRLASAGRMRRYRDRRRQGFRCYRIEIHREFVDALVRQRWVRPEDRENDRAVADAICRLLDAALP